jgi:hypothetical protein
MKIRWWIVGIAAVAAGSVLMIKHFVESKKTDLNFVESKDEKHISRYSHEILDTDFDDSDYLA